MEVLTELCVQMNDGIGTTRADALQSLNCECPKIATCWARANNLENLVLDCKFGKLAALALFFYVNNRI